MEDKGTPIHKPEVKTEAHPLDLLKKRIDAGEDFSYLTNSAASIDLPGYTTKDQVNDYGSSKYDKSLTQQYFKNYGDDKMPYEYQRGEEQSSIAKLGAGVGNAVVTTGLDIVKDASYLLDFENYFDFKKSSEEGFHNWLGDAIQGAEDKLKLPVYRTKESEGFSPTSAGWWGDNLPSIASTLSMIVPAEGAMKGLSVLGKLMGGDKIVKGMEAVSGITGIADKMRGVGAAVISRQMESLMEGGQTFQDTFKEAKNAGKSDDEAKVIAGEAAAQNYKLNWAAIIQDIPEYMILHKTFKESNSLFSKAAALESLKTAGLEGSEEAYQYITDKESKRAALINGKVIKDDNTSLGERLVDYAKDGDLWTSAFFGAIGGAGFGAYGIHKDSKNQEQFDALLEAHKAILKGDPETYYRAQDNLLNASITQSVADGNLDNFKSGLEHIISNPERIKDQDRAEINKRIDEATKQIEYAESLTKEIMSDETLTPELKKLSFTAKLNQRSIENRLAEVNTKVLGIRAKDAAILGLTPDVQAYKEAKLTLEGIKNTPLLAKKVVMLANNNAIVADELVKAYPDKYKSVEDLDKDISSSHDPELIKLLGNKALEEDNLKSVKDASYILTTDKGKEQLKEKFAKDKEKQDKTDEISKSVDSAVTEKDLNAIIKEADKNDVASPDLLDKIAKKREEIKPKPVESAIPTPTITDEAVVDNIDETNVHIANPIDEESKRPTTTFKTNNGPDDNSKEAETRAYRFHDKVVLAGHRLQVVTRNNNPELFNKILEQDPTGKKFEDDFYDGKADKQFYLNSKVTTGKHYNGIYTVVVDKDNNIVLSDQDGNVSADGKMVFETLETESRIQSGELVVSNKDKSTNDIIQLRGQILKLTDPNSYLPIAGKSKGIPQTLPLIDGKRQSIPVSESFGPISSVELELPTQQADSPRKGTAFLSNDQVAFVGKLYAFDKNRTAFDLIPRNVSEAEADMIMNLLGQKFGTVEKRVSYPITQIEKIVSTLIPNKGANDYTFGFKNNILHVGKDLLVSTEEWLKPEVQAQIRQFLISTKHVNANTNKKNGYSLTDKFIGPTIDDRTPGITYNTYKEYLLSGEKPMFGTDLVPLTGVQYKQVYLKYEPTIQTDILGKAEPITDSNGEMEIMAEHDFEDETTEAAKDLEQEETKPVTNSRNFYGDGEITDESLDRSVDRAETKPSKLTTYEKDWFNKTYPNIPVELVKGLIEDQAFGRFLSSGKVLLSDRAASGTLYHEAFHVTTQLYLSQGEIDKLYSETRDRLGLSNATDREIEEKLAEDFALYKENGKVLKEATKRNSLFRRILNVLRDLVGLSPKSIEDIYRRLDKGYYTNKKIVGVRQFTHLNATIPGLDVTQTKELMSGMDAIFFDIAFADNKTPVEALSKTDKVLKYIYTRLVRREREAITEGDPKVITAFDSILSNWPLVMEEWNARMRSLGVNIEQQTELGETISEIVDDDETKVEEEGVRGGEAYKASNEESTKKTMYNSSKMLIRSLKEKNNDGTDKLNSLGLPQTVEFSKTYNYLLKQTVGLSEYPEIYNKIKELSVSKPEFRDLLERIKERTTNLTIEQMLFQNQFRQDFSKNMATSYVSVMESDGTILQVDANKQNIQDRTKEKWKSRLKTLAKINVNGKYIVTPAVTKDDVAYLNSIGIYFSKETLPFLANNKEFKNAATAVRNYVREKNGDLTDLYTSKTGISGNLNTLLSLESDYNVSATELSIQSTEGKTVYPVGLNNGLSIMKNLINNSTSLDDLYAKLPHLNTVNAEGSIWISALFDSEGNRRKDYNIELNLADGLKTGSSIKNNSVANSTRKLGTTDKFVQEMDHLLKFGNSSVVRTADKANEHLTGLNKYNGQKLIVPIKDLALDKENPDLTGFNNESVKVIFRGYFKSELKRIAMFKLYGIGSNIDEYSKTGGGWTIFHSFPFMKSIKEVVDNKLEGLKARKDAETITDQEIDEAIDELADGLKDRVDVSTVAFFEAYASELKKKLEEYKIINGTPTEEEIEGFTSERGFSKELLKEYPVEQLIRAVVVNDFINSVEQMKLFFGDMAFYKALFKRTSSLAGTKETSATDPILNQWLNTGNKRLDEKVADGTINVVILEDSTQSKLDLGEYKKSLMKAGLSDSEATKLLKAYTKMDEGDAQGWITLDEYREFNIRMGSWGTSMEKLWEKAQRGEVLTKEEIKYFLVKKAQYAGPAINDKLFVPVFHKFSLMPLLPQLVKGRNMEKVLANMKRQKVGYALFKSGSKVGTPLVNGKANNFYTKGNHGEIYTGDYNIQKVDYRFLGLQVKSSDPHATVTFGTQFRKLLFTGAFEGGMERIPGARELYSEYTSIIRSQVEEAKARLVKDLGINPESYKAEDVTKLVDLLRKESKIRDLPENIIEALQTAKNEAGKIDLMYPLDAMVNKAKIDSMMMSLINSRLIKQKVNGDAYIQGASTGFEQIGIRDIGSNKALKFYHEVTNENGEVTHTSKAEVMIPMSKQYHFLLEKYGSLEAINKILSNDNQKEIDERLLTLIGYRIPTQGLNSIDHLIVKQFIPQESGQLIILPTEIVAKSGGDYDIDKLNIFRPEVTKEGEYKDSKHNRIIEIASMMLSHPMNFNPLITPNSTSILTDMVDEYTYNVHKTKKGIVNSGDEEAKERELYFKNQSKQIDYTRQLMMTEKVEEQHSKLMLAKDMIGIGAVNNVFIPLAQATKATLSTKYGKDSKVKINFPHNLVTERDGSSYIDLSKAKDALGKNDIQEVNSQIINATVDAANSPGLLASLGMNLDTLSVYLYLNDIGVPFEFSFYMMKQPIIQRYIKEFSINNSGFLAAQGLKEKTKDLRDRIMDEYAGKITTSIPIREYTDIEELKKFSVYDNSKEKTPELDNEFYNTQVQILSDFLNYKEQAQLLSDAVRSINHDTAGLAANLEAVHLKLESIQKVKKDNFVQGLDRILKETPIGAFDQNEFAIKAYSQFYATQSPEIVAGMNSLMKFIAPFKAQDKSRLATMITNDFINFVIQNYGYTDINALKTKLFKGENSVAKQILRIQSAPGLANKAIADNMLIQELQPMIANDKTSDLIDNLRLYTKRFDTFTANQLTEAFNELKDKNLDLFKDIVDLGIIQSGLANSAITYVGIIPFEYYGDLFNKAFDNFNKKNGAEDMDKFMYLFMANNANDKLVQFKASKLNIFPIGNSQFGKDYSLEGARRLNTVEPDETTEDQAEDAIPPQDQDIESDEPQFSKKADNETIQKLKDSGYISQHNGELYIKQNFFAQATNLINSINKETPGLITKKMLNHFGKGGRQIWAVKVNDQLGLQFGKGKQYNYISEQAFREIADKLKAKTGVEYDVVSPEEALRLLDEHGVDTSQFTTNSAPGFYLDGKIVIPSNYLTAENAFHEFAHPFVDVVLRDNKALFVNLKRQMQSSIEGNAIVNEIKQTYKELVKGDTLTDNGWKEAITTALGRMAKGSITESKDKGLFTALKQMLKRIGETLSKLFSKDKDIKAVDLKADTTLAELANMLNTDTKIEVDTEDKDIQFSKKAVNPFEKQDQYIENEKFKMDKQFRKLEPDTKEYNEALEDIHATKNKFDQAVLSKDEERYKEIGSQALDSVEEMIGQFKTTEDIKASDILNAKNIIDVWKDFKGLKDKSAKLEEELYPFISNSNIDRANENSTRKELITQDMIDDQTRDIGKFEKAVSALADSGNILASTIGSIISKAHNKVSSESKKVNSAIQEQINKLASYSKKNGVKVADMYEPFIVEVDGTTRLIRGEFFANSSVNPNWKKIQDTPELKEFYDFYKSTMDDIQKDIPGFKGSGRYFIPNIKDRGITEKLKDLKPFKERSTTFVKGEDLKADVVPMKMHKPIPASEKSKNLGHALSAFAMFSNNYAEMSKILPEVRLLQEEIKYVRDAETGKITDRKYIKPSNPSSSVIGEQSNLNKMVDAVIAMQVKGQMKNEEWKPSYAPILDENGDKVGEKYIDVAGTVDNLLAYNSMLRIGLSPITAISNVIFGDVSNIIEAVGGRFMTIRGLIQASNIFMVQTWDEHSVLNQLLERLNPLQELDDYEYIENIKSGGEQSKMSPERLKEYMYLPQKKGEKWLQSRTMLAVMIKEGYLTSKGELTEKYKDLSDEEIEKLSVKVQRLNQLIHGRYTAKEAATLQQSILYRTFVQFRKWIPAAIENRIGEQKWDNRLQAEMEGRYRTWARLIANMKDTLQRLKEGKLTDVEIYNSKKMLMELVTWAIIGFAYAGLHGDDDKDKKFRKNPLVKTALTLLSRTAGDIEFFYAPTSATKLTTVPLAKTMDDIMKTVELLPTAFHYGDKWKVTKGRHKGQSKFRAQFPKIIVGANPFSQIMDLASNDALPY